MKTLFLYILFFSGCLRMQVDRYWYSPVASLPIRMFPRIETHFDVHQIYGTERIRNIRIGFEKNEKMEKGYVFLENGKEFSLSKKSVYIPNSVFIMYLYNEDGTFSEKRFINVPEDIEKITIIAK
ncbi:MAG TPA: hypothetical protein PKK05_13925 [Leptospiraceae bacterium]|nr:hypothetical protein [Leptospiraceae bacterium]